MAATITALSKKPSIICLNHLNTSLSLSTNQQNCHYPNSSAIFTDRIRKRGHRLPKLCSSAEYPTCSSDCLSCSWVFPSLYFLINNGEGISPSRYLPAAAWHLLPGDSGEHSSLLPKQPMCHPGLPQLPSICSLLLPGYCCYNVRTNET